MTLIFYIILVAVSGSVQWSWGWFVVALLFSGGEAVYVGRSGRGVDELEDKVEELESELGDLDDYDEDL